MRFVENIKSQAMEYAKNRCMEFDEQGNSIIFLNQEDNFFIDSFSNIKSNSDYSKHYNKKKNQLKSSTSSDALLMSIFCHPKINIWKGPKNNLFDGREIKPKFGIHPNIDLADDTTDNTEIDMEFGDIYFEAKLAEAGFPSSGKIKLDNYMNLNKVFESGLTSMAGEKIQNYQLIRNVLATIQNNKRHRLICDQRRGDLVREYYKVVSLIKDRSKHKRFGIIFWQEISRYCGKRLKDYLSEKYCISRVI